MMLILLLAATGSSPDELVLLDRRIQAAMVANDAKILSAAIADDFSFAHADGSVETKRDVIRTAAVRPRYYLRRTVISATAQSTVELQSYLELWMWRAAVCPATRPG